MPSPAIVLVHGAFGDASSWRPVYDRLAGDGHTVLAPPNPLRGIPYDASFTASIIDQIDGPVVLVGHSYGGAVITVAGDSEAELDDLLAALPLADWLRMPAGAAADRLRGVCHGHTARGAPQRSGDGLSMSARLPDPSLTRVYRLEATLGEPA